MNTKHRNISKLFSKKEANQSLVLVSKIAHDIQDQTSQIQILKSKILIEQRQPNRLELEKLEDLGKKILHFCYELECIGAQILNIEPLIIGFPYEKDNQILFYTWSLNQITVSQTDLTEKY